MKLSDDQKRKFSAKIVQLVNPPLGLVNPPLVENQQRVILELAHEQAKISSTISLSSASYKEFAMQRQLKFLEIADLTVQKLQTDSIKKVVKDEFIPRIRLEPRNR